MVSRSQLFPTQLSWILFIGIIKDLSSFAPSPILSFFNSAPAYNRPLVFILRSASSDASNLLYQEQEKLIIKRGETEEHMITKTRPLQPNVIKIRGAGKAGGFGKSLSSGPSSSKKGLAKFKAEGRAHAKVLSREGVVRIDNILSSNVADRTREYLYDLRYNSEKEIKLGKLQPIQRFADVLLRSNRCDLTIPLGKDVIITEALSEALCKSPVAATIASLIGEDATLHELSCLMSDPGSQRQVIHPDTPYIEGIGATLYTCFIALQDVEINMGPTVWLPKTHTKKAHEAFMDNTAGSNLGSDSAVGTSENEAGESRKDSLIRTTPAVLGLLPKGCCAIFDSRCLHCGTANTSKNTSRALLYFSFKNSKVGFTGNPPSIRAELGSAKVSLRDLVEDLDSFNSGKGTPLIDELIE